MTSEWLNRWLTLGANVGVIAGIVFLAYEIRQNSEALNAQSRYSHAMVRAEKLAALSSDPVMPQILLKAQGGNALTPQDQFRLRNWYMALFVAWQWEWQEHKLGRIQAPIRTWKNLMEGQSPDAINVYPGLKDFWISVQSDFSDEFVAFMNEEIIGSSDR